MRRIVVAGVLLFATASCARHAAGPAPDPDAPAAPAPDLSSLTVMILPAQAPPPGSLLSARGTEPVPGFDSELAFFLAEQAPRVHWVNSDAVNRGAERARSIHVDPRALAVSAFTRMRVQRIGDPLWGDLRLLGEVMNARYAVLPFQAGFAADSTGTTARVEVGAAIIDTGNGNVLWVGYAAGDRGPPDSRATVASAARALARRIAP